MSKPTRRTRRFIRRKGKGKFRKQGGKGVRPRYPSRKGKGKGSVQHFLAELEFDPESCFYAKGGRKGTSARSSGRGFGRKSNPRGPDGSTMKCHICGSEEHLRRDCPQNAQNQGFTSTHLVAPLYESPAPNPISQFGGIGAASSVSPVMSVMSEPALGGAQPGIAPGMPAGPPHQNVVMPALDWSQSGSSGSQSSSWVGTVTSNAVVPSATHGSAPQWEESVLVANSNRISRIISIEETLDWPVSGSYMMRVEPDENGVPYASFGYDYDEAPGFGSAQPPLFGSAEHPVEPARSAPVDYTPDYGDLSPRSLALADLAPRPPTLPEFVTLPEFAYLQSGYEIGVSYSEAPLHILMVLLEAADNRM